MSSMYLGNFSVKSKKMNRKAVLKLFDALSLPKKQAKWCGLFIS